MSIQVEFASACLHCGIHDDPEVHPDFHDVLSRAIYVFVHSDEHDLPTDPVALVSLDQHEVDCILTASTWKFPASMSDDDLLDMTQVLVSQVVAAAIPPA